MQYVRFFVENLHLKPKERGENEWMEKVTRWERENNVPLAKRHNFDTETKKWMKDNEYEDTEMDPDVFFSNFLNQNGSLKFDEIERMFKVSSFVICFYIFCTNSLYFIQAVDFIGPGKSCFFLHFLGKWIASKLAGKTTVEMRNLLGQPDWNDIIKDKTLDDLKIHVNEGHISEELQREMRLKITVGN